jgi:hypothetical protein
MADQDSPSESSKATGKKAESSPSKKPDVRLGAVLAGVLVLVVVGWLLFHDGGDDGSMEGGDEAIAASVDDLRSIADERSSPVYWAGQQEGTELEVTQAEGGDRVYVRYLTGDAEAGDQRADFLTIGSYAFKDADAALRKQAQAPGGVLRAAPGGGTVYYSEDRPQSVYVAYPGADVQVEVYDPDPQRALELVTGGQIVPVE